MEYLFPMEQFGCNETVNKNNNNSYLALPMVEAARDLYEANEYKIKN